MKAQGLNLMKHMPTPMTLAWLAAMVLAAPVWSAAEAELKDESGKTIVRYVVEAPLGIAAAGVTDPARQVGLILCFQEHDTPTGNDIFPVRQTLIRLGQRGKFVLLAAAPQSRKFGIADHEPIEKLIAWAMKTYPVNPRRVYMFGKGEGSKISMEFTMAHPNVVTAAIGYSWGAWRMPSEVREPLDFGNRAPELYLTLGRRDLDNHLSCVRDAYLRLKAKGYHLIHREFDELADRSYHPPSNDDAIGWAMRLRNKNIAPSGAEAKLLRAFAATPPAAVNGYYPALALVGGTPAGAILEKLFLSKDPVVRAAAAETCKHGIFGASALAALAKLTADPTPEVRQSAIRALAMHANWRYPAAQAELIAVATSKSADLADRLNATDGLAFAVRFQVKGVRQDPAMLQALVTLSQEKEEPLRATASAALAPAYEPPPPGAPRRRSPEGGWEKWIEGVKAVENAAAQKYAVCGWSQADRSGLPGNRGKQEPVDLFCSGGAALRSGDLAAGFRATLEAAGQGYGPAQNAVAMLYATGKGTEQNYAEAGNWWVKAAMGGDLAAARHAWNLYRNGEGVDRNPVLANQMAALIGEPQQTPRNRTRPPGGNPTGAALSSPNAQPK